MTYVLFDLNGTLLDPAPLAGPLGGDDGAGEIVSSAFELAIVQGMTLALTGEFVPFSDLLGAALRQRLAQAGRSLDDARQVVELAAEMPPFPHAEQAVEMLSAAGYRLAVITNSSTSTAQASLERAGLRDSFELILGSDSVRTYKPDERIYATALAKLAIRASDAWMVAAHWWDLAGARAAGLRTAWSAHKEGVLLERVVVDIAAPDLEGIAAQLIAERD